MYRKTTVRNNIALFGLYNESAKFKVRGQGMEAPLEIRAWTLLYSLGKALAEPVVRDIDNRPRLFFYTPAHTTIARYRTGFQLSANSLLFQPAFAGNTRLVQVSHAVDLPVEMKLSACSM